MNKYKRIILSVCALLIALRIAACGQINEDEPVTNQQESDMPTVENTDSEQKEEEPINQQESSKQTVERVSLETKQSANDNYYSMATSLPRTEVEDYAAYVKQLFMEHDWLAISSEIAYPITISGTMYPDSAAFLEASDDFDSHLNEEFFSYLEEEDCVEMFFNSEGIMLGETGQIWIADVYGLKILAINDLLKDDNFSIENFWEIRERDSDEDGTEKGVRFATGLELVYPDIWRGKIVLETDADTLAVCEKKNADAGIGGDLFYLRFYEHEDETVVLYDWDNVLGLYRQGGKEYVLVQDFPEDRCYSEDEQSLIDAYMELENTIEDVEVKTENMTGYLKCGIEDLDWVQYESDWENGV